MQLLLIEAAGWIGAALILGSYILVSIGKLSGRSRTFQWMNVVGAAGFVINSGWHGAIPSTALNAMWLAVGLATLWSVRRRRAGT
jgi:MYXO-CTERM domain-containing protein